MPNLNQYSPVTRHYGALLVATMHYAYRPINSMLRAETAQYPVSGIRIRNPATTIRQYPVSGIRQNYYPVHP